MAATCEWCGAPLPDAATLCYRCGKEVARAAPAKVKKKRSRALFFTLVAILLLLLAALAIAFLLAHLAPPAPPASGSASGAGAQAPAPSPALPTPPPGTPAPTPPAARSTVASVTVTAGPGLSGFPILSGESPLAEVRFTRVGAPPREVKLLVDGAPNWTMEPAPGEDVAQALLAAGSVGTHTVVARDTDTGEEVATSFRVAWDRLTVASIPANATAGAPVNIGAYLKVGDGLPTDWQDAVDVFIDGTLAGSTNVRSDAGYQDVSVAITPAFGTHLVVVQLRSDPQDGLRGALTAT